MKKFPFPTALLHKSVKGRAAPIPKLTYPMRTVCGVPKAVKRIWTPLGLLAFHSSGCRIDCSRISGLELGVIARAMMGYSRVSSQSIHRAVCTSLYQGSANAGSTGRPSL